MATVEELQAQMAKNSADWHTAGSTDAQNALHQANIGLQSQIDSMTGGKSTFNDTTGTWSSAPAASGGNAASSYVPLGNYNDAGLSGDDNAAVQSLKYQYAQAMARGDTTAAQAAHAQAEKIRSAYGYSTTDGSDKILIDTPYNVQKQGLQTASPGYDQLKELYAAQQAAALQNLKTAYDSNMQDVNAAQAKIAPLYQAQRNQTASTAAVNRANFNEQAAASGLNTGAGSQAALSQANALTNNMNTLNSKEAEANTDIETQRLKLQTQYNNAIAQAQADNNAALAQALYNEYVRVDNSLVETSANQAQINNTYSQLVNQYKQQEYENQLKQAQDMAAWGDFSGYKSLNYPDSWIADAEKKWAVQNPLLAYGVTLNYSTSSGSTGQKSKSSGSGSISTYTPTQTTNSNGATTDSASNLSSLNYKLSQIEDSKSGVQNKVASIIKQYLNSGAISEATATKYLSQYGL